MAAAPSLLDRPPVHSAPDLYDTYFTCFRVCIAATPQEISQAHGLRYQVYCAETGFLNPQDHPDQAERDAADGHADQALLLHKPSGRTAGMVRLIRPDPARADAGLPARAISRALRDLGDRLPLAQTGEISRLLIAKEFRKRRADTLFGSLAEDDPDPAGRRIIPHIALGLMQAVFAMSLRHNLSHLCAVVDPRFLSLLTRLGATFQTAGPVVDFHGPRQPVWCEIGPFLERFRHDRPDIWDIVTDRGALVASTSPIG
ncbi:MAG: PEP-CTERM/exosortase system-associated acyltransferase [Rhodothalassiaceae bacterium]